MTTANGSGPALQGLAVEAGLAVAESAHRFPDGGAFRVEIPSVEGPEPLDAVLTEAERRGVVVHRVSQGSGIHMLTDGEISDMLARCGESDVELCLFLGPRANWDVGAGRGSDSRGVGWRVRGGDQLRYSLDDAQRAVALGLRCLLVADEGVLWSLHRMRESGELPADVRLKLSALSGPANPASFAVVEALGADSVNILGDLSAAQVAELRAAGRAAIDLYIEAPDGLGGFVRHHEAPVMVRVGAPIYLKFGLRNAPDIYPVGEHLRPAAVASGRERVRRAELALSLLDRCGLTDRMSPRGGQEIGPLPRFATPAVAEKVRT